MPGGYGTPSGGMGGEMSGSGMPGSGMSGPGMPGPGMSGPYPGSSSRTQQDNKSPRTLAKKGENPGNAPVIWMQGLTAAGSVKFDELTRILTRVSSYDTGQKAGEEMRPISWIVDYFILARNQVKEYCLPLMETDAKKSMESSMSRLETRYKKLEQEYNRIKKSKTLGPGFQKGLNPNNKTAGPGGIM